MPGGQKSPLKTATLGIKPDKLVTKKPRKSKQPKIVRVEHRADGDLHWSEKPEWCANGIKK